MYILGTQNAMEEPGDQAESSDEESSEVAVGGPSEKAWGKKKSTFYSTDFIDDELGGMSPKAILLAMAVVMKLLMFDSTY